MKRNFGHPGNKVDPLVKRFFPWGLFLALAVVFLIASCVARAEDDQYACYGSSRYQAMYDSWPSCSERNLCDRIRQYIREHPEESKIGAIEEHLPKWIMKKAEACLK
jgi:hypothetical protein